MARKLRLDLLLVERGHFPSREQAQRAIMAGEIKIAAVSGSPPVLPHPENSKAITTITKVRFFICLNYFNPR